jgi:hypothetical protein
MQCRHVVVKWKVILTGEGTCLPGAYPLLRVPARAKHHSNCISSSSAIQHAQDNPIPVSSLHSRNALGLSLLSKGTMMEENRVSSLLFRHLSLSPLFKKKKNVNLGYPAVA